MLQTEFEERIGKKVQPEVYNAANRVYMACPSIDKDRFCKEWKEKKLDESHIVADLTDIANHLELEKQQWQHTAEQECEAKEQAKRDHEAAIETNRQLAEERDQLKAEWEKLAVAFLKIYQDEVVKEIIGKDEVISLKCAHDIYLNDEDKAYLAERLKRR